MRIAQSQGLLPYPSSVLGQLRLSHTTLVPWALRGFPQQAVLQFRRITSICITRSLYDVLWNDNGLCREDIHILLSERFSTLAIKVLRPYYRYTITKDFFSRILHTNFTGVWSRQPKTFSVFYNSRSRNIKLFS